MSSPLIHKANYTPSLYKRYLRGLVLAMVTSIAVLGCDAEKSSSSEALVQILENEVVVDHSLVQTSIPERYQPSYNLQGALIPVNSITLTTPYPVLSASIEVKERDEVKKGQTLAKIDTQIAENKLPYIAGEFLDVYVDGVQIPAQNGSETTATPQTTLGVASDKPSQPQSTDNGNNTASNANKSPLNTTDLSPTTKQDDNETEEKLIPVTLVLKSSIDGTVTSLSTASKTESVQSSADNANTEDKPDNAGTLDETNQGKASSFAITVANTQKLQLVGKLPLSTQSQLSVGKPVYFTVYDLKKEFTGQISHIIPDRQSQTLTVRAPLVAGENSKALLKPGMQASMNIEYGQIELGVRLPRNAIHEANLDELTKKRPRPNSPIKGYVWIVEQDQRLAYTPVEVVQYFAESDQFLVSGISNESIVCLADLPKNSDGKKLSID